MARELVGGELVEERMVIREAFEINTENVPEARLEVRAEGTAGNVRGEDNVRIAP